MTLVRFLIALVFILLFLRIYFLWVEQKSLYYPDKTINETPRDINVKYEDVYFQTEDGEKINGWFIPGSLKTTILFCHGNAGNMSHRLHRVKFFHDMGFNVLLFDYRGYGKSTGKPSEKGLYKDTIAAYDYLREEKGIEDVDIIAYGKSLGGAMAADLCLNRKVKTLVIESTFSSVTDCAKEIYPFLPASLIVTQKYDTESKIGEINIPKLILHGRNDEIINFKHAEVIYNAANEPKEFIAFWGGHNDDVYVTSNDYKIKFKEFLDERFPVHVNSESGS